MKNKRKRRIYPGDNQELGTYTCKNRCTRSVIWFSSVIPSDNRQHLVKSYCTHDTDLKNAIIRYDLL